MDPEATLAIMQDETLDRCERAWAAMDLLAWMAKGGNISLHREGLSPQADTISDCQGHLVEMIEAVDLIDH